MAQANNIPLNTLKDFALDNSIKNKSEKEFGERIIIQVENLINSSYFKDRNLRFVKNRQLAAGKMDMTIFQDLLDMFGKTNYVKLNFKPPMIVNTIVSRLVSRWMATRLKPKAEAIDPVSTKEKKEKKDDAEFYLDNKEMLSQIQEQTGVPMIPKGQFLADDKDHLDLWAQEELRTPEEILFEKAIRTVFKQNKLDTVQLRKLYKDSAEVGLVGICSESYGDICTRVCVPENMFYTNSDFDDFHDCSIKGEVLSYTISEIREAYPELTEEKLYEIAKLTKDWQENGKITWNTYYNNSLTRPYDDWNVDVACFELRSLDVDGYEMKVSKSGRLFVDRKDYKPNNTVEGNSEYTEKTKWNIYKGCYVRTGGKRILLEWGEKKNKITPQNQEYIGEAESSYSFYMYQNVNMRNVAIPEKIEEPVEGMALTKLKIQQLTAKMRNAGYKYDIDGMQEMDLGNGKLTPLELQRVTDQTGDIFFRGRDTEGNRLENPVTENPNAGSVPQMQQLIALYNFHYQCLRDELGEDPNLNTQAATPRVTTDNIKVAMQEADNATGHMEAAVIQCLTETANKVACLLHDSVSFGAEAYRDIMQEKDVKDREFKIVIEMQPDDQEIAEFIMQVNQYVMQHPDFILYISPLKLKTLAQENLKLANIYFENAQKRAIQGMMEQSQQQQEQNGQIQQQAAQTKAEGDMAMEQHKTQRDLDLAKERQKEIILNGFWQTYAKGVDIPQQWKQVEKEVIANVGIPLFMQNEQMAEGIQQQQEEQQEQQTQVPQ